MRIDIFIKLYIKLLKNCWWKSVHTKWQILVIACVITMVSVISAVEPGIVRIYDMTINRYDPYDIAIENIKKTEAIEYSKIVIERGAKKALVETKEIRTSYENNDTVIIQGVENSFLEFYDYTLVLGDLPENENDILLDTKFIENKSYNVGDQICLELPDDNEKKSFKISGFIRNKKDEGFGIYRAYISIDSANSLLKSDDSYSLLITGLYDDENDLESFYKNLCISERFAEHISINSKRISAIIDRNKSPFAYICFGIGIFLTIVSGVLVFNIFQLSEKEKIQQIGLIRSIGLSKKQVRKYLNCEILMYIIIGTIIGVIFYTILELLFGRVILNIIANAFVERTEIPWGMDFRVLIMCCGLVSAIISFSYYIIFHKTYLYTPIDNIELREKNINIKRKHGMNTRSIVKCIGDINIKRNPVRSIYTNIIILLLSFSVVTTIGIVGGVNLENNTEIQRFSEYDYELSILDGKTYVSDEIVDAMKELSSVEYINSARDGHIDLFMDESLKIIDGKVVEVYVYDDDMMMDIYRQNGLGNYDTNDIICYGVFVKNDIPEELNLYKANGEKVNVSLTGIIYKRDKYGFPKTNNGYVLLMNNTSALQLFGSSDKNRLMIKLSKGRDIYEVREFLENMGINMEYSNLNDIGKDSQDKLRAISAIVIYIMVCFLIMSLINLLCNIVINIDLRKKEYGILYAVGFSKQKLKRLLCYEIISQISTKYIWTIPFTIFVVTNVLVLYNSGDIDMLNTLIRIGISYILLYIISYITCIICTNVVYSKKYYEIIAEIIK